jgi:hypothetical protein
MINPFKEINWKPDSKELRKFAWSLIVGFPFVASFLFLAQGIKTHALPGAHVFLMLGGIGAGVGLVCLLIPSIAKLLYPIWYFLAACIGIVMANLILMLLFFGLFAPMGLFMRLVGRDPLNLKWKRSATSHWIDAPPPPPASQYFRQF